MRFRTPQNPIHTPAPREPRTGTELQALIEPHYLDALIHLAAFERHIDGVWYTATVPANPFWSANWRAESTSEPPEERPWLAFSDSFFSRKGDSEK